jgi:hypothetical protein
MPKGVEAGNAFLAGVVAKLSPEDRARGQELIASLQALGNGTVIAAVGDGTLAQSELSRQLDELAAKDQTLRDRQAEIDAEADRQASVHTAQVDWFTKNKAALDEAARLKKEGKTPVADLTATGGITEEALTERMQAMTAGVLGFARDQNQIMRDHFAKFGEVPDLTALLQHPKVGEIGLLGVYTEVNKDRLAAHDTAQKAKQEETIRADERRKIAEANQQMPYLAPTGAGSGSPLDALTGQKDSVVDAATLHYNRLQQERGGAPG